MNKKNKILIGCLALLLALSVGYALFSDTITINGTATAKGEFKLVTTCDEEVPQNDPRNYGSITDVEMSCGGNIANVSATLDYPGTKKWFRIMVKNEGTIPAILTQVIELNNSNDSYFNINGGWGGSSIENCQGDKTNQVCARLVFDAMAYDDYNGESTGYDMTWDVFLEKPILDPGETAYFYIEMYWNSQSTTPGDPLTASMNVEIDWQQVTN